MYISSYIICFVEIRYLLQIAPRKLAQYGASTGLRQIGVPTQNCFHRIPDPARLDLLCQIEPKSWFNLARIQPFIHPEFGELRKKVGKMK